MLTVYTRPAVRGEKAEKEEEEGRGEEGGEDVDTNV